MEVVETEQGRAAQQIELIGGNPALCGQKVE